MLRKNIATIYDYSVTNRDALNDTDHTSISVSAEQVITENLSWIEFNFPDIAISPSNIHYLVFSTEHINDN